MGLVIKKAGILDSFQDLGRYGYQRLGINPGGAMDRTALRIINLLLGNPEGEAGLEMHFPAAELTFSEDLVFALGGAEFDATINGETIENWRVYPAKKGDKLKFKRQRFGTRSYLSVAGGFEIDAWLGSLSTNLIAGVGGFQGRSLKNGDQIAIRKPAKALHARIGVRLARSFRLRYSQSSAIRITKGADYEKLTALSEQLFSRELFRITGDSNRMGFRLDGKPLHLLNRDVEISSAVNFGTMQILPNGQIVILMADHQTTGGYPKIAHIIKADLPTAAQLGAGDEIGFRIVSLDEAETISSEFERDLSFLRMGVRFNTTAG